MEEGRMVSLERFEEMVFETEETLPEDFFRELHGGVMVKPESRLHPADLGGDLYVLGEYRKDRYLGRFVVLYYGSFAQCFPSCPEEELGKRIRRVMLHEFRHHLESLAGERDLELEDARAISQYRYRQQKILDG